MIAQNAIRARLAASHVARRGFSTTRAKQAGFHYPEGPRNNLPFNPLTRFFAVRFWGFCAVGFSLPFGVAVFQTYKTK